MTDQKRPYKMKKRAEQQEMTRLRIVESAVHLHGTLGPAQTPMSAVAEHAGVPRSTLYRHFSDDAELFQACSAHWAAANPTPDLEAWVGIGDPDERLLAALPELYAYYRQARPMLENVIRDAPLSEALQRQFEGFGEYFVAAAQILTEGRGGAAQIDPLVAAAVGHVISFGTWRSLTVEQGLTDKQAVELGVCTVQAAQSLASRSVPAP